ncbi:MAG TPA: hypothetical protein VL793_15950 [Patescibacteria group bacterium]|nr:hypothetical protein [Patescibacteria group bacterium]
MSTARIHSVPSGLTAGLFVVRVNTHQAESNKRAYVKRMKRGNTLLFLLALNLTAGCASYELKYGAADMEMYQEPLQPPIPAYPPAPPPPAPDTNRTSRVEKL